LQQYSLSKTGSWQVMKYQVVTPQDRHQIQMLACTHDVHTHGIAGLLYCWLLASKSILLRLTGQGNIGVLMENTYVVQRQAWWLCMACFPVGQLITPRFLLPAAEVSV